MHTCRTFYTLGVPFLLRDVVLDYVPATKHTRWLLYRHFFQQNPSRFRYLRRLKCYYSDFLPLETSAGLFTDLFHQSTYLERLDIMFVASISAIDDVIHHIAQLQHLRHLTLRAEAPLCRTILGALSVPLTSLRITNPLMEESRGITVDVEAAAANNMLLPPSHSFYATLEEISVDVRLRALIYTGTIFPPGISFPAVRKLRWQSLEPFTGNGPLATMFPHLLHLDFSFSVLAMAPSKIPRRDLIRLRNEPTTRWDDDHTFNTVRGDLFTLYVLGIHCRTKYLEVNVYDSDKETSSTIVALLAMFPVVVESMARPPTLRINLWSHSGALRDGDLGTFLYQGLQELSFGILLNGFSLIHTVKKLVCRLLLPMDQYPRLSARPRYVDRIFPEAHAHAPSLSRGCQDCDAHFRATDPLGQQRLGLSRFLAFSLSSGAVALTCTHLVRRDTLVRKCHHPSNRLLGFNLPPRRSGDARDTG